MTRQELSDFHQALEKTVLCRFWSWEQPQIHHQFLRSWPPGYIAALARWKKLPWRLYQLLAIDDHDALEPGLYVWRSELGFELHVLHQMVYDEAEFRMLAAAATPSMAFLRGLLWRADPEIAAIVDWATLQEVLVARRTSLGGARSPEAAEAPIPEASLDVLETSG